MSKRYSVTLIGPERFRKPRREFNIQLTDGQYDNFLEWNAAWKQRVFWWGYGASTLVYAVIVLLTEVIF